MSNFFPLGGVRGAQGSNLRHPHISETTRARELKLNMRLDVVKYSLWVQFFSARGVQWLDPQHNTNANNFKICLFVLTECMYVRDTHTGRQTDRHRMTVKAALA